MKRNTAEPQTARQEPETLAVAEEQLEIGKREIETGRVRVAKRVVHRHETVDVPLMRDEIDIRRVPVMRPVDAPVPIRQEGDVTIVSVLEEVLVVRKQLVVKEELHISRRRSETNEPREVTLSSEQVEVTRIDSNGRCG